MHDSKKEKIDQFNPSGIGLKNNHFIGLPFEEKEAEVVLLPVPWDVTVSYAAGTASGPANILDASSQLDLFDPYVKDAWKMGLFMRLPDASLLAKSESYRTIATEVIDLLEKGAISNSNSVLHEKQNIVNEACEEMVDWVEKQCMELMRRNQLVGLVGGDHSTPLGYLKALAQTHDQFGILQIDAHMDLRKAYEGFTYSHASIFYNALGLSNISRLVQVGIRDYCDEELVLMEREGDRIHVFFDHKINTALFEGISFRSICLDIISKLPNKVYISFDIDGLQPFLCPNTGTPVPGGLSFEQVTYLLHLLVESGKTIIGFDLCEVGGIPHEWDGNVGARIAYKLANLTGKSNNRI